MSGADSGSITITLTRAQALAIWRCAGCAADTHEDALAVLGQPQRVAALNRGMETLEVALFKPRDFNPRAVA